MSVKYRSEEMKRMAQIYNNFIKETDQFIKKQKEREMKKNGNNKDRNKK